MAKNRSQYRSQTETRYYVDGTTVRREEPAIGRAPEKKPEVSSAVRKNRERAKYMTLPFVVTLAAATVMMVVTCYQYLSIQSSITNSKKRIAELKTTLSELKTSNNAEENNIEIYTDLDYIYDMATGQLGMVYPREDQVIQYDKKESEYVRQYEDIPTQR